MTATEPVIHHTTASEWQRHCAIMIAALTALVLVVAAPLGISLVVLDSSLGGRFLAFVVVVGLFGGVGAGIGVVRGSFARAHGRTPRRDGVRTDVVARVGDAPVITRFAARGRVWRGDSEQFLGRHWVVWTADSRILKHPGGWWIGDLDAAASRWESAALEPDEPLPSSGTITIDHPPVHAVVEIDLGEPADVQAAVDTALQRKPKYSSSRELLVQSAWTGAGTLVGLIVGVAAFR